MPLTSFSTSDWQNPARQRQHFDIANRNTTLLSSPLITPAAPITHYGKEQWVQRTKVEYAQGFNSLLPQGPAWPRQSGSALQEVVSGLAQIWGDNVETLAAQLLTIDSDPRKTVTLLPDWERAWGLPDICNLVPQTIAARQTVLVTKMTLLGAQSREFFTAVAASIGYSVTIHEWSPFMCGMSRCGDTRNLDDGTHYYWEIGAPEMRFYWLVHVGSLAPGGGIDLECSMRNWKPAHTGVLFDYSTFNQLDYSEEFNSGYLGVLMMP